MLRGGVFVGDDENLTTLTVEPGVTVLGEERSFLTITRSSRLVAEGSEAAPIVFTSARAVDDAAAQSDWGGIIINGRAPINSGAEAMGEGNTGAYGGSDPTDDSGSLRYVVVAYAGFEITSKNELNAVAFQGVGSGTTVDYLHVHMGKDDGIEFFGGTVGVKHVLLSGIGDDNIDWTDGWQGKAQFVAAVQYDVDADNGIEADNSGDDNALTPISDPTLSNLTLVGIPGSSRSDLGVLLREGTRGSIYNSVVMGFGEACLSLDQDATFANAEAGTISLDGVVLHCPGSQPYCDLGAVAAASGG